MVPDGLTTPEMVQDRWPLCEVPGNGEYTPGKEGFYILASNTSVIRWKHHEMQKAYLRLSLYGYFSLKFFLYVFCIFHILYLLYFALYFLLTFYITKIPIGSRPTKYP